MKLFWNEQKYRDDLIDRCGNSDRRVRDKAPLPPAKGAHLIDAILTAYGRAFEHPGKIRFVRWLVRALAGGRIKMRHVGGTVIAVDPADYIGWADIQDRQL